ncbi:MAG: M1 family aminopeptidase [Flavobacteriales bacterium]
MRTLLATALILVLAAQSRAQQLFPSGTLDRIAATEMRGHGARAAAATTTRNYDVRYLRLEWSIDPAVRAISGQVTTWFTATADLSAVRFDLDDTLIVDDVLHHGASVPFTHGRGDSLHVELSAPLSTGTLDSLTVVYHGTPPETGFGSFVQDQHAGAPIVWTLSEPYGAPDWWPCKQDLSDKADSMDVYVTVSEGQRAAGNGVLVSVDVHDGLATFHWRERHPIAHYLIATAVTNYATYSDTALLPSGPVEILNYVYPEHLEEAQAATPNVARQLELFSSLFGEYPFADEKYGHAEFGWGGGMEHQTMSFVGGFNYEILAHELAHQWFGDKVTCGSWADIWLNEGFATYLSALVYERLVPQYWYGFKRGRLDYVISQPGGTLRCDDTTTMDRLFDGRLTYAKGALVLNMLRWICGDSAFFAGASNYLHDPALAYASALTPQLQAHLEAASGVDLDRFFSDWYLGQGFPSYTLTWSQDASGQVNAVLDQVTSHPSVDFFALPVPVRFKNATQDSTVVLDNTFNGQPFTFHLPFEADSAELDPELWLISGRNVVTAVEPVAAGIGIMRIFPNPSNDRLTVLLPNDSPTDLRVLDALGRTVLTQHAATRMAELNVQAFTAGTYLIDAGSYGRTRFVKR